MVTVNQNYLKLPGSYLFSTIAKKVAAYQLYRGRGDGIPAGRRFEEPPGSGERPSVYDRTGCRSISRKY